METTFAILAGLALFALFVPKRGRVTEVTNLRRGLRVKWQGTQGWPADAAAPKFKAGQKVTIHNPAEKDPAVEGKTVTVKELVYSEVVDVKPDGSMSPVAGLPGLWSYVTDLVLDGQPVRVAENSLVTEGASLSGDDDAAYLCGDLPIDRILSSGMVTTVELGYSWKKFGRALKKAAKWCWKNKYVRYGLAAAAQALNVVAPGAGVALGAGILLVGNATNKDKKVSEPALKKITEIKDLADKGDTKAKEALSTITIVREAQKEAAKEGTPPEPEPLPDLKAEETE